MSRNQRKKQNKPNLNMERNQIKEQSKPQQVSYALSSYGALGQCYGRRPLNYDFSGYITLVENSYYSYTTARSNFYAYDDDYYSDTDYEYDQNVISFGVYLHVMVGYLWARLFYLAESFGQKLPFSSLELLKKINAQDIFIPTEIHEYLKNIGEFTDRYGIRWYFNIPEIAIPQQAIDSSPGGHFGLITEENHNLYECYIAPYTTAMSVKAEISENESFDPLPPSLIPTDSVPTEKFLGYSKRAHCGNKITEQLIKDATFATDEIESRIQHSKQLQNRVNRIFSMFESKLQVTQGLPMNLNGSPAAISHVISYNDRSTEDSVHSKSQLTKPENGLMMLFAYRKKRDIKSPGYCLLTKSGNAIDSWESSINNNFEMKGLFGSNTITEDLILHEQCSLIASGCKEIFLNEFIKQRGKKSYDFSNLYISRYDAPKQFNCDFSGYITLIEESYKSLCRTNLMFSDCVGLGGFMHVMVEYLWLRLIYLRERFQHDYIEGMRFEYISVVNNGLMPKEIYEYLKNIGKFTDKYGIEWQPHIPKSAIPEPATADIPGGHFGAVTAENHNLYECYISPYTTAMRAKAEKSGEQHFDPLPPNLMPTDTVLTENFLGYIKEIPKTRLLWKYKSDFHNLRGNLSRLQHSNQLKTEVNHSLNSYIRKERLAQGIPLNYDGSPAAIAYVTNNSKGIQNRKNLRNSEVEIESVSQLTQSEIGVMSLFTYRRKRTAENPGYCFLQSNGEVIENWEANINNNFELKGPFSSSNRTTDSILNVRNFRSGSYTPESLMPNFISKNFER